MYDYDEDDGGDDNADDDNYDSFFNFNELH
jgi:hypothetical protein